MKSPRRLFSVLSLTLALIAIAPTGWTATKKSSSGKSGTKAPAAPDPRPNLILIIADDLGWQDSAPYGNAAVRTPNLSRLAAGGMRFDQAFVTASSCSPSRASIITGRYPHQTSAEELHWPVPATQETFVEKLKEAGYWTGAAGKWHLGDALRERFDDIREADESGFQLPAGKKSESGQFSEKEKGEAQSGCTEWLPLLADRPKNRPFFLWLASLDPHRDFSTGAIDPPHRPEDARLAPYHPDTPEVRADYAAYYDEISRFDQYVGKLLDELDKQELTKNTAILLISDNGRPFPRDKTTLYDGGIRTPWIIRWPEKVKPGSSCGRLVSTLDIAPTFLEMARVEKAGDTFEGRSFLPLLSDPETPLHDFIFAEKNWHDYEDHARAARTERYKYIRNAYPDLPLTPSADAARSPTGLALAAAREGGRLLPHQETIYRHPRPREELYDTIDDPHELKNLAADPKHRIVIETLRTALDDWEQATADTVPDLRTADEFDRETGKPTAARIRPRWDKARMIEAGLTAP
jgi:N-sulfoglucosamine sulfohydrolase